MNYPDISWPSAAYCVVRQDITENTKSRLKRLMRELTQISSPPAWHRAMIGR